MNKFKVGDLVKCIDDSLNASGILKKDWVYEVINCTSESIVVYNPESSTFELYWFNNRFELYTE
jgi:hypothetical protein